MDTNAHLMLVMHGGKCCGIKTIYNFPFHPGFKVPKLNKMASKSQDSYGYHVSSKMMFFSDGAPEETGVERLDRFLEFLKKKRPEGLVEVTLTPSQISSWGETLEERGFKAVTTFKNSNSGNKVTVYHLVMG